MKLSIRSSRHRFPIFRFLAILFVVWPTLLYLFLAYVVPGSPALVPASLLASKKPLLVTAHPDDESLFFGPTLLNLIKYGNPKELRILVFSAGNNYGLGDTRKKELEEACHRIGAKECVVLDREEIQDNPKVWWNQNLITSVVKSKVVQWGADAVITFDSGGVSGHINHRAVSSAVA